MNNRKVMVRLTLLGIVCLFSARPSRAEAPPQANVATKKLIIGTKSAPPFAMKGEDGQWKGISIELWNDIAKDLGLDFEYREYDLNGLLKSIESGQSDLAVAAITVNTERERRFDFSHAFFFTGLGIAVQPPGDSGGISQVLSSFFSEGFLRYLAGLVAVLLAIGLLIWSVERKSNSEDFAEGPTGIWDGFWWSAVTMTTVGYGDVAPRTFAGRILGLIWMFAAIIIISFFTAGLASSLTVSQLETGVNGPEDLPEVTVGTIKSSSSERYLLKKYMQPVGFNDVPAGLAAVASGEIDAFVYDRPILQYHSRGKMRGKVRILESLFDAQSYAIGMPTNSSLREQINTALLTRRLNEKYWHELTSKYLGE